jgi:cytochrome P450 family 9
MILWLTLLLILLAYKWLTSDHDYFKKINIPFEKPLPLVGNLLKIMLQKESIVEITTKSYYKFKHNKIYGMFNFLQSSFVLTDPEVIKTITVRDFDHFLNHNDAFEVDRLFSRTIFVMRDKKWRDMRTTLSPIFTSSRMKMMFGLLGEQSNDFVKFLQEQAAVGKNKTVDIAEIFSRYTADAISTTALGFMGDSVRNEKSELYSILQQFKKDFTGSLGALKFLLSFTLPKVYKLFDIQIVGKDVNEFFKKVVLDEMDTRERKGLYRPDVIQLLMDARKGQLKNEDLNEKDLSNFSAHTEFDVSVKNEKLSHFDDLDWIAQGFMFFGAGFDTSTDLLQVTCYELALNRDIQRDLIAEVDEVGAESITYEALHKMKFLDMVVSESLRKWPPAGQLDRMCNKEYKLDLGNGKSVKIEKGKIVFLPVYQIHHDPDYFAEPEKFNPYRFSDENKHNIVSGTYLAFGSGPRSCLASRFALMSVKLVLTRILSKFTVETCEKTPKKLTYQPNINFKFNETIFLNFIPRN